MKDKADSNNDGRVRTYSYGRIAQDYLRLFSGPGRRLLAILLLALLLVFVLAVAYALRQG